MKPAKKLSLLLQNAKELDKKLRFHLKNLCFLYGRNRKEFDTLEVNHGVWVVLQIEAECVLADSRCEASYHY